MIACKVKTPYALASGEHTVSLSPDQKNIVLTKAGAQVCALSIDNNPIGISVSGTDLFFQTPLENTLGITKFKIKANTKLIFSIEPYKFPGDIDEYAAIIGAEDIRTGRTISAFSVKDRIINVYRTATFLVVEYGNPA